MQRINVEQGDAILDLLQQCRVVQAAWEQQEAFERHGMPTLEGKQLEALETEVSETYKDAVKELIGLYAACKRLEIEVDVLCGVLTHNLPATITGELTITVSA